MTRTMSSNLVDHGPADSDILQNSHLVQKKCRFNQGRRHHIGSPEPSGDLMRSSMAGSGMMDRGSGCFRFL